MNSFAKSLASNSPNIPLVNLFAYIRDLFHTAQPELQFDDTELSRQKVKHFVSLEEIIRLRNQALPNLQWQTESPDKAIFQLKRTHIQDTPPLPEALVGWVDQKNPASPKKIPTREVAFEQSSKRVKNFEAFFKKVNGKRLDEVKDLSIPENLEKWMSLDLEDERLVVKKVPMAEESFEADPLRQELLKAYKKGLKNGDASRDSIQASNKIYDTIHDWYYRLKAQPELQLFLSFGLFQGGKGNKSYKNYLFHVPLKLELHRQELRIVPDTLARSISCEQHFTELIPGWFSDEPEHIHEQRQREVIRVVDLFNEQKRDFSFDKEELRQRYYYPALDLLGIFPSLEDHFFEKEEARLSFPEKAKDENRFIFSFSPVIQLRHPGNHINVSKDADLIMQKIQELGKSDQQREVPSFFQKMFSLKKSENPLRIVHKSSNNFLLQQEAAIKEEVQPRYYFPLPYNQEQLAIAQRLESVDAATVQGPPGTGKSHTIANLAAHYAATGKSVLIVSKYAKALEVIRGKLPKDIQDLAISFTDNEQHREALKHSIDGVKARLHDLIPSSDIEEKEKRRNKLDELFEKIFEEIAAAIGHNGTEVKMLDLEEWIWKKAPLSTWLEKYASVWNEDGLIRDSLAANIDVIAIARELHPLLEELTEGELQLIRLKLQAPENLPRPEEVNHLAKKAHEINQEVNLEAYDGLPMELFSEKSLDIWQELKCALTCLDEVVALFSHSKFRLNQLKSLLDKTRESRKLAEEGQHKYLHLQIEIPGELEGNTGKFWGDLNSLIGKFNSNGRLSLLKKNTLPSSEKTLFSINLNGKRPESLTDFEEIKQWLNWKIQFEQLEGLLHRYFEAFQLPLKTDKPLPFWGKLERAVAALALLEKWNAHLEALGQESFFYFKENVQSQIAFYDGFERVNAYQAIMDELEKMAEKILPSESHPLLKELKDSCSRAQAPAYKAAFEAYEALARQAFEARKTWSQFRKFEEVLPLTLEGISNGEAFTCPTEATLLKELLKAQLKMHLKEHLPAAKKVDALLSKLREINAEKAAITSELVGLKAWRHRQENISDEQRSALSAWRNDLINLGKGYGKNATQHIESAVKNLQLARELVPIWIMSLEAAIRFFPDPQPGQFDLLIIDEASQVDISALNLIFRARKTLVVGDENQTSVFTNSGLFPIERTNRILERFLEAHPFKQQFNINNRTASIYSLSGVIYPNIITLKEHFRCRPEIISYSNKYVYNHHIIPLRTPTHQWYGPAAEVKYIEDEGRNKKKPNIVQEVVSLIEDSIQSYQNGDIPKLPSVGILCLDSSNETHREALQRGLFKSPLIKSFQDELGLLVGTSREFQGDERDVMILTSTAIHSTTKAGVMRPPRAVKGEEMMRIYNVAVSRAREKVILLHCIHPEALPLMKPECYRGRLIRHLEEMSGDVQSEVLARPRKVATPGLVQEVENWLKEEHPEWDIRSKHIIGPYKMDLALVSTRGKVAIWCDEGEAQWPVSDQLKQQFVMERAGWRGLRIQALEWYCQKDRVLERLKAVLQAGG